MSPELAHLLLILALVAAAVQAWAGLGTHVRALLARLALVWQLVALTAATVLLGKAFVQNDFSVMYVVQHGHVDLPLLYKISAIWGGHEGSLLLWVLILAMWSALASWGLRHVEASPHAREWLSTAAARAPERKTDYAARVLGFLGLVSVALLAFILFTSNPFVRLLPMAEQGQSLNPLLQDPGLALHPPLLYLGYVGAAVPFAMTLAALAYGPPAHWIKAMRPFALLALAFLSVGIALGSWWAYYELGWGGWWFWDPVENASFMPWLVLAALTHTLVVRESRRSLPHWTAMLAIAGFILSLLGLFLVRSGVITSVHAFASDPRRGVFMLGLMAAFLLAAMSLYARYSHRLLDARGPLPTAVVSRETGLLLNNLLLTVACASVLLGTLYPLAMDALGQGQISVGPPYFNAVIGPVFLAMLALMAPAVWLRWGSGLSADAHRRMRLLGLGFGLALVVCGVWLQQAFGQVKLLTLLTLAVAAAASGATVAWAGAQCRRGAPRAGRAGSLTASQWGMVIAHLGVAAFACGVAVVSGYGVERDVRLAPGDVHRLADCDVRFERVQPARGPNYTALAGHFTLVCEARAPHTMVAEKRDYVGATMPMTESAIDWGLGRDMYIALGEPLEGTPHGAWSVRVQHKPLMRWVWLGVVLMALGAVVAACARRYGIFARQKNEAVAIEPEHAPAEHSAPTGLRPATRGEVA